jgi:hypothetical protein
MKALRTGHAPGHVRETFENAIYVFHDWDDGPEPTVEYEVHYVPRQITLSQACGLLWNCTDIMPGHLFDWVSEAIEASGHPTPQRRTYAAVARAMLPVIQSQLSQAA